MSYRQLSYDVPIRVYADLKKTVYIIFFSSLFIAMGLYVMYIGHSSRHTESLSRIIGIASIVFGALGICACLMQLTRRWSNKPICVIFSDRIVQYAILKKRRNQTILFRDINQFIIWKFADNKFIRGVRPDGSFADTVLNDSNVEKIEDMCEILNLRLENYHSASSLNSPETRMRF